ncbi:hypothetical protein D3C87_1683770 [compost metagenome]
MMIIIFMIDVAKVYKTILFGELLVDTAPTTGVAHRGRLEAVCYARRVTSKFVSKLFHYSISVIVSRRVATYSA